MPRRKTGGQRRKEGGHRLVKQSDGLIPGLPDELAVLCIARIPRAHHHSMRSVCRGWRDFVHGREFSELRCKLSVVEHWLYVWTQIGNAWRCFDPSTQKWLRLPKMPPDDNRVGGYSAFASFDGKLFVIGGFLWNFYSVDKSYVPCRTVSYFDVRSGSWKRAADLNMARAKCMVGVIGNKLYVFGGYVEGFSGFVAGFGNFATITAETYDPVTDSWRYISSMSQPLTLCDSVVIGQEFYTLDSRLESNGVVYDAQKDTWASMTNGLRTGWDDNEIVVLNGKLYTILDYLTGSPELADIPEEEQRVRKYNPSKDVWEVVRNVDRNFWGLWENMLGRAGVELVNLGGKLCIVNVEDSILRCKNDIVIRTAIVEVGNFTKIQTFATRFRHKLVRDAHDCRDPVLGDIKACQVIAL